MQQWTIRSGENKDRNKCAITTKHLRHSGPDTTYRSYAQIKNDTTNDGVNSLFSQEGIVSMSKPTSCEDIQIG